MVSCLRAIQVRDHHRSVATEWGRGICRRVTGMVSWMHGAVTVSGVRAGITVFVWASAQELSLLPINATCAVDCRLTDVILGGPTKVKPTYIFVSKI